MNKKYNVIYADPPWYFKNFSEKGTGRNAIAHYDCMSFQDLENLNIKKWASKNCVLFLWVTDPILDKAFHLLDKWEFKFKTVGFYWAKLNKNADEKKLTKKNFFTGLGYWTRANPEQCWIATRGSPPRKAKNIPRLVISKRREHSRKPDEIYEYIEKLCDGPYLELFARKNRKGWDTWGNEKEKFNDGYFPTRNRPSNISRGKKKKSKELTKKQLTLF
jgi:N6-adenosine-specific RNA methylase IME4